MIHPESSQYSMDQRIAAASRDVARQVIERAERTGTHIIIWRDGQVVRQTASQARTELKAGEDSY